MAATAVVALLMLSAQLSCPSVAAASKLDEEPELAAEQVKQEAVLEVEYARMKQRYGLEDRRTLEMFFRLFDLWIMLYRLNKADAALQEILPACEWRRDAFAVKAVQALAFTRWKQGRYREALERFHEMEGWLGRGPALCENIGHTYSALGAYGDAELYFGKALELQSTAAASDPDAGAPGGVLLGLAVVRERMGNESGALVAALEAYDVFRRADERRGWVTSLTAKAAMQVSKLQMALGELQRAEALTWEALRIFEETAGEDSPLVVGAHERLGAILLRQGRRPEAAEEFHRALRVAATKDAMDLLEILELQNALMDVHLKGATSLDRGAFLLYFEVTEKVVGRIRREFPQDGNAGALYKAAGEVFVVGGDCSQGQPLLLEAAALFRAETSIDTSDLVRQCTALAALCNGDASSTGHAAERPATPGSQQSPAGGAPTEGDEL